MKRSEAIALAKRLAGHGCGRFITGRRKGKSRIEWSFYLSSLGNVARGNADEPEEIDPNPADGKDDNVSSDIMHVFKLRPDKDVNIALPEDFTKKEAERLAAFINSLPFDS